MHRHVGTITEVEAGHCEAISVGPDRRHGDWSFADKVGQHGRAELADHWLTTDIGGQNLHASEGLDVAQRLQVAHVVVVRDGRQSCDHADGVGEPQGVVVVQTVGL